MTDAERAAALADDVVRNERKWSRNGYRITEDEVDLIVRALRCFAETEARPAGDLREVVTNAIIHASQDGLDACGQADAVLSAIDRAGCVVVPRKPTTRTADEERSEWVELFRRVISSNWHMGSDGSLSLVRVLIGMLDHIGVEAKLFSGPKSDQVEMVDRRAALAAKETAP